MSALPNTLDESQPGATETGELESVEAALLELNRAYAANRIDLRRLTQRRDELLTRKAELRRVIANNYLDAFLPPINLYSIEREGQTEAQRRNERHHQKRLLAAIVRRNNPAWK
ncbi:MAG TPA: hypothetical protein VF543_22195 [Pyrinomonadaceae bacterium]